jgi:hypothetical protein
MEFVAGLLIGFVLNIVASWIYDWIKTKGSEAKQAEFIEGLNESVSHYIDTEPSDEEVNERRKYVKSKVIELSENIFGKPSPPLKSLRQETTKYPPIHCRWCHRDHKAKQGSRGECNDCKLPLDLWIGCQSESNSQNFIAPEASTKTTA